MIKITHGMVLAAGLGTRMRPLTENRPKPLLKLRGKSLLDHALDRMGEAGLEQVVVNAHWCADQVEDAVKGREVPKIVLQREVVLLETGGGIRNALPSLGKSPFAVVNGDAFWTEGPEPALSRLADAYDPKTMDGLLLLVPTKDVTAETGQGDFFMDPDGKLRRPQAGEMAPYVYAGVQVLDPLLIGKMPIGPGRLMPAWLQAIGDGRLYGLPHSGSWYHLSTPGDLDAAEIDLSKKC